MYIIEPCCAERQLQAIRRAIDGGGTTSFEGYGDMSLTELLPALLTRYSETEMLIVAPSLPDQAADIIKRWMCWKWARADGNGTLDVIRRMTVIADLSEERSPAVSGWMKDDPFGGRLSLVHRTQDDTAILFPDLAVTGPVNMRYGNRFVAEITTDRERVAALWGRYRAITEDTTREAGRPAAPAAAKTKKQGRRRRAVRR